MTRECVSSFIVLEELLKHPITPSHKYIAPKENLLGRLPGPQLPTADLCQVYSFLSSELLGEGAGKHATLSGCCGGCGGSGCRSSAGGCSLEHKQVIRGQITQILLSICEKQWFLFEGRRRVSYCCWRWGWGRGWSRNGHIRHSRLDVIFEGSNVTLFFHDDAERHSQGNVPGSLRDQDFGQVTFLLHLKACVPAQETDMMTHMMSLSSLQESVYSVVHRASASGSEWVCWVTDGRLVGLDLSQQIAFA